MKVVMKETKTFYTVVINHEDFLQLAHSYNESMNQHIWSRAFKNLTDFTDEEIIKFLRNWRITAHGDTAKYIAESYGYDGWYNIGFYNEHQQTLRMIVFNYGDTM